MHMKVHSEDHFPLRFVHMYCYTVESIIAICIE